MGSTIGKLTSIDLETEIGEITGEDDVKYGVLLTDLPTNYKEGMNYSFEPIRIAFSRQPMATEIEMVK